MSLSEDDLLTKIDRSSLASKFKDVSYPVAMDRLREDHEARWAITIDTTRVPETDIALVSSLVDTIKMSSTYDRSTKVEGELRIWPDFGALSSKDFAPEVRNAFIRFVVAGGDPDTLRVMVTDIDPGSYMQDRVLLGKAFGERAHDHQRRHVQAGTEGGTFVSLRLASIGTAALTLVWGRDGGNREEHPMTERHPLLMRLHFHPAGVSYPTSSRSQPRRREEPPRREEPRRRQSTLSSIFGLFGC